MNKKLIILSLIMLGCSGQVQAMSALKQGMQNATRVCGQWVKKNPKKVSVIAGIAYLKLNNPEVFEKVFEVAQAYYASPKLTFKARSEIKKLCNQYVDGDVYIINNFLSLRSPMSILTLSDEYITKLSEELSVPLAGIIKPGTNILIISSDEIIQANAFFREKGESSDISLTNCLHKAVYAARNFMDPEHYPLSDKGHVKGIILHEIGHVFHSHADKKRVLDKNLFSIKEKYGKVIMNDFLHFLIVSKCRRDDEREADAFAAVELTKEKDIQALRAVAFWFNDHHVKSNEIGLGCLRYLDLGYYFRSHPYLSERVVFFAQKADELEKQLTEEASKK